MSQADPEETRELDLVLWGATGFTGRLVAEHLLRRTTAPEGEALRWALAGRSREKLEAVRDGIASETGRAASDLPLIVGDAGDPDFLEALTRRARAVCSTVGPYARYGSGLVASCARAGTHYCDLTGELQWIRRMIDLHHEEAVASGARIVFCCGFDCIPADLGTFFLQREAIRRDGAPCSHVKYRVADFAGGMSGGTVASMLEMMEEAETNPEVRRVIADPYAINPKGERGGPEAGDSLTPSFDEDFGEWVAPFVMAAIDTRVVRRSNALLGYRYGKSFRYDEGMLTGKGPIGLAKASGIAAGLGLGLGAMAVGPIRRLVARRLPQPGEGPDAATRESGHFEIRLHGRQEADPTRVVRARVTGDRDPGYGSTSKMLGESALCLTLDDLQSPGGCSTPAAAMGDALLGRLDAHAGVRFVLD